MKSLQEYQKVRAGIGWLLRNRKFQAHRSALRTRHYLQVGCGPQIAPGFVNLDYRWVPGVDVVWDLRHPLPFPDNRFRGIYTEHCLEHFDETGLVRVLRELQRVLIPGGRLRVVVPSLEVHVAAYLAAVSTAPGTAAPARTMNRVFYSGHDTMGDSHWHNDGHHFIHDYASLAANLATTGFVNVQRAQPGHGADSTLLIDRADRTWESLYVEAEKVSR